MSSQHLSEPSSSSSYHRANMMITLLLLLNIISSLNGGAVSPKDTSEDEPSEIQSTLDQDSRSNETSIKEHKSNNHDLSESIPNVSKSEASMDSVGEETKRPQRPRQSAKRTKQMRNKPAATETDRNSDTEPALAFDPSYFASLNAANHRPVQSASSLPLSQSSPAVSIEGLPGNESKNLFYYSPETYGKLSHRNHQNTAFTFTYGGQTTPQTVPILKPMATPSTSSGSDSSNSQLQVSSTTSGTVSLDGPEKSKSNESPVKPVIVTVDKTKPKIKNLMQESNTTQSPAVQSGGTKKKEKDTLSSYINDKFHSGPLNPEPYDDAPTYEVGDGNTNSAEKYYYQDPFMVSMTRSKTLNPKQGKPYRYPDIVPVGETGGSGQGSPPTAPLTDYVEEDYESPDSYSDFKNLPMIKSALSSPKYVGPAPYRYPPYTSYYPTRFYAPYDGETAPGKSQSSGVNSWSGLAGFLLGILPLGILMASMVPAFVSVPVASAAAGVGRKKRSLSRHDQMTKLIEKYEKTMEKSEICVKQFLCNALRHSSSDTNNKPYYTSIESLKSTKLFRFFKMNEILSAAKGDRCDQTFKCKRRPLK